MVARRKPRDEVRIEPVAELCVDVVGADHRLRELRPRVGVFVGEPRPADHCDRVGPARDDRLADRSRRPVERGWPRGLDEGVAVAEQRRREALFVLDRFEAEAALVAQPTPVDRIDVDALVPQHAVA